MKTYKIRHVIGSAFAACLIAGAASAATWTYDPSDHPNGAVAGAPNHHNYGIRLDHYGKVFSFEAGSTAKMVYDDVNGIVQFSGTVIESIAGSIGPATGPAWDLFYQMTGVTDLGGGFFEDFAGNGFGSLTMGGTTLSIGAKAKNGLYFKVDDDDHRLGGNATPNEIAGRGWVDNGAWGGANDFLFTVNGPPVFDPNGKLSPIPLPAAGLMLMAALGGLGMIGRRRKAG